MAFQSDGDILMAQGNDSRDRLDGVLTTDAYIERTRARATTLEHRWQACGLPQGDATNTLRAVTRQALTDWRQAQQGKAGT